MVLPLSMEGGGTATTGAVELATGALGLANAVTASGVNGKNRALKKKDIHDESADFVVIVWPKPISDEAAEASFLSSVFAPPNRLDVEGVEPEAANVSWYRHEMLNIYLSW